MIPITQQFLPYVGILAERPLAAIDLVIIHCTELPDMAMAREYGTRVVHESGAGNSGHYYIDRDGSTVCYVPPERMAHHCRGYNPRSVGIELVNIGRYPDWFDSRRQVMTEPYPAAQIHALDGLLASLRAQLPNLACIAGHEDLDTDMVPASNDDSVEVPRKRDPGPQFPWGRVLDACRLRRIGTG
ncbi:N-acetylmuramoyl-L-alanine amidase [Pinirhizobacter soli]|uniref:N-acetylmuramoyl-L-alanine amidase n=1 Tax=Pinirhizobacter soli TaxID=2786953 RepID=UPI00202A40A9|nr:N-acetylmuramoyl-L-alanine amidase [Pinirhizobacter soli]